MGPANKSFQWNTTARHDIKPKARNFFCTAREDSQLPTRKLFFLNAQLSVRSFLQKEIRFHQFYRLFPGSYSMKPGISLLLKIWSKKKKKSLTFSSISLSVVLQCICITAKKKPNPKPEKTLLVPKCQVPSNSPSQNCNLTTAWLNS